MKKTIRIIIATIILFIGFSNLNAQEQDSLIYKIKYEFTGEVVNEFDSVFNVYLVVAPTELEKFVQFEVNAKSVFDKTKTVKKEIISSVVSAEKQTEISSGKEIKINLGTSKASDSFVWEAKGVKMVIE